GFTLLEIIVVVFIISLGLLAIVSLVTQNIQVEFINKNMLVASQLSQEGLELVRNKRDVNWLRKDDWQTGTTTTTNFNILQDGTYTIDYTGTINSAPNSINDPAAQLYLNGSGFYNHTSGSPTPFSRLIIASNIGTASTSITCLVQWKRGTNTYNFAAETALYNWR
ncbi:MAG TPA: hypothetical protein VMD74_05070, partial [Candidatus Methylomirabilis sp.]|nr:hypothetical protein [Candidatus Methylomirabilis sp.]